MALVLLLMYLPIVVTAVYSFNANQSRFTFQFTGFSLQHYNCLLYTSCVSLEDFNRLTGRNDVLEPDQIYLFPYDGDSIELLGLEFETLDPGDVDLMATFTGSYYGLYGDIITLVTPDMATLEELDRRQQEIYDSAASSICLLYTSRCV